MGESKKFTRKHFLLGGGALAATVGGYTAYNLLRSRTSPARPETEPLAAIGLEDLEPSQEFDVCIIGSGPAGAVLGIDLARQGVSTLIVESGLAAESMARDRRYQDLEQFSSDGSIEYPAASSRIRGLGGTSNIWTGRCSRLHQVDFEENAYTPAGAAWPFDYDAFQQYYALAERTLRVRGGELSNYHAPRLEPLPVPQKRDISGLKALFGGIGVTIDDSPTSKARGRPGPVRVRKDLLPEYVGLPGALLLQGATVTRLDYDTEGSITAAHAQSLDKSAYKIRARIFVVAAGTLGSARLLLSSTSDRFPTGIGNTHDNVGRYFNEHPNLTFTAELHKNVQQLETRFELGRCHQYYDELKKAGLGSAILVANHSSRESRTDAPVTLTIGATLEMLPVAGNRIGLATDQPDHFGMPGTRVSLSYADQDIATLRRVREIVHDLYARLEARNVSEKEVTWSHHHIGGCCMGNNPQTSVVDKNLKVHETDNLYVLSSGTFVTGGAGHPTLAIVALAHRMGKHLEQELKVTAPQKAAAS